jgi:translation initiation factor IF-2
VHYGTEPLPITREVTVTEGISVKDLAEKLEVRAKDLIATLLMSGIFVTVNQSLDAEMVKDVAAKFGAAATVITYEEEIANQAIEEVLEAENTGELEVPRSPVVTVMGHVDHGKTSLLDAIRKTDVAAGEAGGITQHIGAYKVRFAKEGSPASGREIVFLDTPGHEAFTRMRARGAKVTDIVVIVVAADDGVMPQTLEAIDHAKAADVPIIVAVNKIDKPDANPERVKKQLADRGLIPEEWAGGGEGTVFVEVSAKKQINLDLLLEMICLVSDIKAPKATPGRKAVGSVLEAKLDRGRGAVATVLVQDGTLHLNDSYIVGNTFGKVRAMFDDRGRAIEEAGPSTPVEVLGLEAMPDSGDTFLVVADRDKAKGIAQYRKMKERDSQLAKSSRVSLEGLAEQIRTAGVKDLGLIIKGDVTGSVEVLADSLVLMSTEKVRVKVIHSGVGSITESDVLLAAASNALIIGFNVRPERKAAELANQENVEIRLHSIIYELQDEMRLAMLGLLEPVFKENYIGRAEVINVFRIPKVGTIAGCRVQDGVIRRDAEVKVMRGTEQIFKGKVNSLKRFKDDAKEATNGMECGIGLGGFNDLKEGDLIEAFSTEKLAADLGALTSATKAPSVAFCLGFGGPLVLVLVGGVADSPTLATFLFLSPGWDRPRDRSSETAQTQLNSNQETNQPARSSLREAGRSVCGENPRTAKRGPALQMAGRQQPVSATIAVIRPVEVHPACRACNLFESSFQPAPIPARGTADAPGRAPGLCPAERLAPLFEGAVRRPDLQGALPLELV